MGKEKVKTNNFLNLKVTHLRHVANHGNTFIIFFSIVLFSFHNHQKDTIEDTA